MEVSVGPPVVLIHFNDEFLVCEMSAEMSSTKEQGYFAADTRLVSGYRLKLGGKAPVLLNGAAVADHSARFEFTNPPIVGADGKELREHSIHLRLDRTIGPGVHEDYDVTNHGRERIVVDLEVSIESDFADLFDVKADRPIRRGSIHGDWDEKAGILTTRYQNGTFDRSFVAEVHHAGSPPDFANGGLLFRLALEPKGSWHLCLWWTPVIDGEERRVVRPCDELLAADTPGGAARRRWLGEATVFETSNPNVTAALRQAVEDLAALRLHRHDELAAAATDDDPNAWVPAAGIPWFVSLFGRDALTVSFQTLAVSPRFALGSLRRARRAPGRQLRRRPRHATRQDRARDTPRRARRAPSRPAHPVLRHARRDDALRPRRRARLALARRCRRTRRGPSPRRAGARVD